MTEPQARNWKAAGPVVCYGELLLRLETTGHERFCQAETLRARFTGGEANAAVALRQWGMDATLVSAVPPHELGDACLNEFRRYGVGVEHVRRTGGRLGLFYYEAGSAQRASNVIYDRAHSAFCGLRPGEIPWDDVLRGKGWFHVTGTAPALTPDSAEAAIEACRKAFHRGLPTSMDPNFRSALWRWDPARSPSDLAGATFRAMFPFIRVLITNPGQASDLFGICPAKSGAARGDPEGELERQADVARRLAKLSDSLDVVALTFRESLSASHNRWGAMLYEARSDTAVLAPCGPNGYSPFEIRPIVDRVGAGDAFAAGLIFGLRRGLGYGETLSFATAASCLKHSIPGDFCLASEQEVRALMSGDSSGRIRR